LSQQHYNNKPGQGSQYLWTLHWSRQQNVVATSERKMTKNKTMMQQIHKAPARETKSMEQITLELSRHLRKKPKSARFANGYCPEPVFSAWEAVQVIEHYRSVNE